MFHISPVFSMLHEPLKVILSRDTAYHMLYAAYVYEIQPVKIDFLL